MDLSVSVSVVLAFILWVLPVSVFADVTYWLDASAANNAEVKASVEQAVPIYNKYGSFNKHLSVYYDPGIPTVQYCMKWAIRWEWGHFMITRRRMAN